MRENRLFSMSPDWKYSTAQSALNATYGINVAKIEVVQIDCTILDGQLLPSDKEQIPIKAEICRFTFRIFIFLMRIRQNSTSN